MARNEFLLETVTAEKYRICVTCSEGKVIDLFGFTGRNKDGKRYRRNTCNACRAKHERNKRVEYSSRAYKADKYECVGDKHGEYFGAVMNEGAIQSTMGVGYLPPDSRWRDNKTGRLYRVVGNDEWWFLQNYIGNKCKVDCGSQRLVEVRGSRL